MPSQVKRVWQAGGEWQARGEVKEALLCTLLGAHHVLGSCQERLFSSLLLFLRGGLNEKR